MVQTHPMFQKKAPKAPTPPAATPEPKSAAALAAEDTPDPEPKRRKLDAEAQQPDDVKMEAAAKQPEAAATTTTTPEAVKAAATTPEAAKAVLSDTSGPFSMFVGTASADRTKLSAHDFDPALRLAEFPKGKAVGFALLSDALVSIEALKGSGKGSRKTMTVILTNLFRVLMYSRPEDLVAAIYILCNKVAPDYESSELGVGDSTLMRAMCETFGSTEKNIKKTMEKGDASDLGEVALLSRVSQKMLMMPPKLSIEKVFAEMKGVAAASGNGAQKTKKEKIQKLLVASRGEEAKYIVRMMQAKLRVGIQTPTLLQALAYSFVLTRPASKAAEVVSEVRTKAGGSAWAENMATMEAAVKQAYCEQPNWDLLVKALLAGHDYSTLPSVCHLSLGVPVKPMLAKPSKGLGEVTERLTGKRFTGEWKYDGERCQIHVINRDKIMLFSRNSENMTEKYPDVIKVVQETLAEGVENCMIDSELVAYDQTTKKILPFQILSTRGRKNIAVEDVKVNVCIFAFDCMIANGETLVKKDLEYRRNKLWETLVESEGKVKFATYKNFDELKEEDVEAFLNEALEGSTEGLMLKTLNEAASYEPSKRSLNWLKLKKDYMDGLGDSIDVVPLGAFFGKGKRTGTYGAFLLAIYNSEEEEYQTVCKAGTGFSDEDLVTHYNFFKEHMVSRPESNYNVSKAMTPDVWFEAKQVWEIKAADLSISPVHTSAMGVKAEGKGIGLRFPRFLRIRDDKQPEEATSADQIVEMFESQASISNGATGGDDDDF